jgi:2-C-methyl-D-erythritol 4-phosphate cytidylyltransferase
MGAEIPKQYLALAGRCVIEHALDVLVSHPRVAGVCVALNARDPYWESTAFAGHPRILTAVGGRERMNSVRSALDVIGPRSEEEDWVMVHDAARPCVRSDDIDRLVTRLWDDPVGGLLAVPVRDTMKAADGEKRVHQTVDRANLWHALTPQMFRIGVLRRALDAAAGSRILVTDEASAIEHIGLAPALVEGRSDNLKVTHPADLPLAEFFLRQKPQALD